MGWTTVSFHTREDGLIVDFWRLSDVLGFMRQTGSLAETPLGSDFGSKKIRSLNRSPGQHALRNIVEVCHNGYAE